MLKEINRTLPPPSFAINNVELLKAQEHTLSNGLKLYSINGGTEEVVRIEFIFDAGNNKEKKALVSNAVNHLLNAGTTTMNSLELMEKIDFYGAYFQHEVNFDKATVSLYTLNKYLKETLTVVNEILTDSIFPEREIQTYIENTKQRLQINLTKNDFLARRIFNSVLFGADHPYGRMVQLADCDKLKQADLVEFFKSNYKFSNCTIIASGLVDENVLSTINQVIGTQSFHPTEAKISQQVIQVKPTKEYYEKADALQSAIRIGKLMVNKTHTDYIELQVLNTILGGYFGSRLMANIREDKGYTYGIGSGIASMKELGFFYIATEVGVEVCDSAINEIHFEINRLRTELVPQEELDLVKNYLLGSFLGSIENVFSYADKFKGIYTYGLDYSYYEHYFEKVKAVNSQRIMDLAIEYLDPKTLSEVVVGKK